VRSGAGCFRRHRCKRTRNHAKGRLHARWVICHMCGCTGLQRTRMPVREYPCPNGCDGGRIYESAQPEWFQRLVENGAEIREGPFKPRLSRPSPGRECPPATLPTGSDRSVRGCELNAGAIETVTEGLGNPTHQTVTSSESCSRSARSLGASMATRRMSFRATAVAVGLVRRHDGRPDHKIATHQSVHALVLTIADGVANVHLARGHDEEMVGRLVSTKEHGTAGAARSSLIMARP
jgi:hypothetical protein